MKYNMNDYVVVNGKRYYATGGKIDGPGDGLEGEPEDTNKNHRLTVGENERYIYKGDANANPAESSPHAGHVFFNRADDVVKNEKGEVIYDPKKHGSRKSDVINGRNNAAKFLEYYEKIHPGTMKSYGIDIDAFRKTTDDFDLSKHKNDPNYKIPTITKKGQGFDDSNSRRVNYFFADNFETPFFKTTGMYKNGDYYEVPTGRNMTSGYGQFVFDYDDNGNPIIDRDTYSLNKKQLENFANAIGNEEYNKYSKLNHKTNYTDNNGYTHIAYENDWDLRNGYYYPKQKGVVVLDNEGNSVPIVPIYGKDNNNKQIIIDYKIADKNDTNAVNYIPNIVGQRKKDGSTYLFRYANNNVLPTFKDTGDRWSSYPNNDYDMDKGQYAFGGRTTRLYAVGGLTGEQIPIGEQPENYNMVGAGGSHEQNPMGGVPYGVNQDGSQNMVEEGEVSVGNNVFSDRTAISPELCQQLGLPEGTSPAQAMQQIEALYEQGQIGDEEFQEIQQIIFQDQEAQKQNVGQSYQQGEVGGEGVPQEGITPEMMQGSSMPPEAMQGGMQPMPQQGTPIPQTEGITPDMVQGGMYGCGGRMRRW